jgi:hypothetical protein
LIPQALSRHSGAVVMAGIFSIAPMVVSTIAVRGWVNRVDAAVKNPFSGVLPLTPQEEAYWDLQDRLFEAGRYHLALFIRKDVPGVDQPKLVSADIATIADSVDVIGVEINGRACALVLKSMSNIDEHVVNLVIGETAVTVTYCDLVDCVRVIKRSDSGKAGPIALRVAGVDVNKQLVLSYRGELYGQQSPGLPFEDHTFTRTTWGQWKERHPGTLLYEGKSF